MPRGSFAVWLGTTFHGAGSNHTDIPRVGTQMGFNCGWLRPHEANLLLVPPLVARDLPLNVQEVLGYRAHRGILGCIEQQSPLEKLGTVTTMASSSSAVARGPNPFDVEAGTRRYFSRLGQDVPSAVASELSQLAQTNATRAASPREDEKEVLETVAYAQSRHLVNHLIAGSFDDLVDALNRGDTELLGVGADS